MIRIELDPERQTARFAFPDGDHTVARSGTVGGRPIYTITRPSGRTSTSHNFKAACAYLLGLAVDARTAVRR